MNRKELLNILEKVKPGISSKDVIESMSYFYFSGEDITTYNDRISIQHPLKTDFSLFVKASDFHKILSKSTAKEIQLSHRDEKLNIKCKTLNANLATIMDDEVAERISNIKKSLKKSEWKTLPDNFSDCLSICAHTASKQESDDTLTCIKVEGKDCVSSDNKRISHAILSSPIDKMFIKASEIKNLITINPTEYSIQKSWLHFKNEDNCIFSIRVVNGEYPDFLQFFDFDGVKVNMPTSVLEGMEIASVLSDESDPAINIKINNKQIIVSVQSDSGKVQHRSKINYDGEEISFLINPEFLKQMMQHSSSIVLGEDKAKLETEDKTFSIVTALYK